MTPEPNSKFHDEKLLHVQWMGRKNFTMFPPPAMISPASVSTSLKSELLRNFWISWCCADVHYVQSPLRALKSTLAATAQSTKSKPCMVGAHAEAESEMQVRS